VYVRTETQKRAEFQPIYDVAGLKTFSVSGGGGLRPLTTHQGFCPCTPLYSVIGSRSARSPWTSPPLESLWIWIRPWPQWRCTKQRCRSSADRICGRPPSYTYWLTALRNANTLTLTITPTLTKNFGLFSWKLAYRYYSWSRERWH